LKIDIAHAFDSVAWQFLLEVLEFMGFPVAWQDRVSTLLSSASTKVMLNSAPGDTIFHGHGLSQGDLLSPVMFLLVMEVLNVIIKKVDHHSLLHNLEVPSIPHRVAFYVDDLILFIRLETRDTQCLNDILGMFHGASGMGCNISKCQMVPTQCIEEQIQTMVSLASLCSF
jgi:hypothetical protein